MMVEFGGGGRCGLPLFPPLPDGASIASLSLSLSSPFCVLDYSKPPPQPLRLQNTIITTKGFFALSKYIQPDKKVKNEIKFCFVYVLKSEMKNSDM